MNVACTSMLSGYKTIKIAVYAMYALLVPNCISGWGVNEPHDREIVPAKIGVTNDIVIGRGAAAH